MTHVVPEKEMKLRIMDVDYTLFDERGQAVLSFENSARKYFADPFDMYKDLAEEFADTLKDARKGKYRPKKRGEKAVTVALSGLALPEDMAGDAVKERALRFAMYDEARRQDRLRPGSRPARGLTTNPGPTSRASVTKSSASNTPSPSVIPSVTTATMPRLRAICA